MTNSNLHVFLVFSRLLQAVKYMDLYLLSKHAVLKYQAGKLCWFGEVGKAVCGCSTTIRRVSLMKILEYLSNYGDCFLRLVDQSDSPDPHLGNKADTLCTCVALH